MKTYTRSIKEDYLSGEANLRAFLPYDPLKPDFEQLFQNKARETIDRQSLQAVIREQYQGLTLSETTRHNLDALTNENTFTVTTGHQLVLFGGPLYTVYKVMSAIKLAENLNRQFPDRKVVPIFWIHTEDHDFEEINHYFADYHDRKTYTGTFHSKVGQHRLSKAIEALVPTHFTGAMQAAYQSGRSMADAYRHFMHALFDRYGLLMLDADHPSLKARFREVLHEEFMDQVVHDAVSKASLALESAGYKLQIHPREINLFYLDESGRNRIVAQDGKFSVLGRDLVFSPTELKRLIELHPERFSPNVSLRPLYQEMILPNLAYFGGWAEVSYWLQLQEVFKHFSVNFPLVLPRMSATALSQEQASSWQELGFSLSDLHLKLPALYRTYMPKVWDAEPFLAQEAAILQQIEQLKEYLHQELSPTLARSAQALWVKNQRFLRSLHKKTQRVVRNQKPQAFRQIKSIKEAIQPDGLVQERVLSLAAIRSCDAHQFLDKVASQCQPLDFSHRYLLL